MKCCSVWCEVNVAKMSVFSDFQQVWLQRFPENPLPGAWEEHIKLNLAKHKQKVSMFREELRKEEIYVEYLERLLLDIQKHKQPDPSEEIDDVTGDNVSNVNILTTKLKTPWPAVNSFAFIADGPTYCSHLKSGGVWEFLSEYVRDGNL